MNIGAVTRCIKILYRQPDPLVVCLGCRRPQRVCFRGQAEMLCAVRTSSRSGTRRVLPECNLYIYIYTHTPYPRFSLSLLSCHSYTMKNTKKKWALCRLFYFPELILPLFYIHTCPERQHRHTDKWK